MSSGPKISGKKSNYYKMCNNSLQLSNTDFHMEIASFLANRSANEPTKQRYNGKITYHAICFFDPKFVYFLNQKSFLTSSASFVSGKREMIIQSVTKVRERVQTVRDLLRCSPCSDCSLHSVDLVSFWVYEEALNVCQSGGSTSAAATGKKCVEPKKSFRAAYPSPL